MRRRTGLIVALDVTEASRARAIAEACSDSVDALKVGYPLTLAAGLDVVRTLSGVADVVCDFKIADIPPIAAEIASVQGSP